MDLQTFSNPPKGEYKVILLASDVSDVGALKRYYIEPMHKLHNILPEDVLAISYEFKKGKKDNVEWLKNNIPVVLKKSKAKVLLVLDSKLFEYITGCKSSKFQRSYTKSTIFETPINTVPIINYKAVKYNTSLADRLTIGLGSVNTAISSLPMSVKTRVVKDTSYPTNSLDIYRQLFALMDEPILSVDIEAFGLTNLTAGIGTISFSPTIDKALSFSVCYTKKGVRDKRGYVHKILKKFFTEYKGKTLFHRAQYDVMILIYELFMEADSSNWSGFVEGTKAFSNIEDSMLMLYCCTNNTTQNILNLKDNTLEFAGNYAIDIEDITIHEPAVVLEYNARDSCNALWLYQKYLKQIEEENLSVAYRVLVESVVPLAQAEIHGIHIDKKEADELKRSVGRKINRLVSRITKSSLVKEYLKQATLDAVWEYNLKSKTKVVDIKTYPTIEFNPNSDKQVGKLIHNFKGIEVLDTTKKGSPSITVDNLIKLKHYIIRESKDD
jgi:DNA polymerase-1